MNFKKSRVEADTGPGKSKVCQIRGAATAIGAIYERWDIGVNITVDKDIVDSLKGLYFGSLVDPYVAAVNRAYRDFNRTVKFKMKMSELNDAGKKAEQSVRKEKRKLITELFREEVFRLHEIANLDALDFEAWHKELCETIVEIYSELTNSFTYGQAQKWVNMTIKYLYLLQEDDFSKEFQFLHVPIDNYVMEAAAEKLKIRKPEKAWSQWNYNEYISYQDRLRDRITDCMPLRWEFRNWLATARELDED